MSLQSAQAFDSASSGMLCSVSSSDIIRRSAGRYSRNLSFIACRHITEQEDPMPHRTTFNPQKSLFSCYEISQLSSLWLIAQSTTESGLFQHLHPRRNANSLLIYLQWEHTLHTSAAHTDADCHYFRPVPVVKELNNKYVSESNMTCVDMHETHMLEESIVGEQYGVAVLLYAHAKIFLEPVQTLSTKISELHEY